MAQLTVEQIDVLIKARTEGFQKEIEAVNNKLGTISRQSSATGKTITASFIKGNLAVKAFDKAVEIAINGVKESMQRTEDENLFEVSLGKSANEVRVWSEEIEQAVGVSAAWLRKTTGVFTNMTEAMGLSHDSASQLGQGFSLLAQDMASFYNISTDSAMDKLQSALAGMPRPLQELGIMVRDNELEQIALAQGIEKTNGEFTAAQKALLTYQAVLKATSNAQGDLARTINTPSNQLRMLATNAQNLGVAIGNMFQPLLSVALPVLNGIVVAARRAVEAIASVFGVSLDADAYSSNFDNASTGLTNVGDAADDANSSVKKLKKNLAGFDEMNVLTDNSATNSGTTAASGVTLPSVDFGNYTSAFSAVASGIENKALKVADKIGKYFNKIFDFKKIKQAFSDFWSSVQRGAEPVWRVITDVWRDYLEPFFSWVGNDLLPAFLNTFSGAIELLGGVIGNVWDSFLKPFIDNFLKPIAEWTGGIIVDVLNNIGDALHWISEQEQVVNFIANLAGVIAATVAGVIAWNAAATFLNGILGVFMDMGLPVLLEETRLGMVGITAGSQAFGAAASTSSTVVSALHMEMGTLSGALTSSIVQFGLAALAVTTLTTLFELFKLKTMEAELADMQYTTTQEAAEQAATWYNEAIQRQHELKDELREATDEVTSAELGLLNAQETTAKSLDVATGVAKSYGMTVDEAKAYVDTLDIASGNLTEKDRKLAEAILKLENNQNRENDALQKLQGAKSVVAEKTEEQIDMAAKEILSLKEQQIQAKLSEGKYDEVSQALQDLANSSGDFQLANGEMVHFTTEQTANMANVIGDHLARIDDESGQAWKSIWRAAEESVNNLSDLAEEEYSVGMDSGERHQQGVAIGIENNQWRVEKAARNSALAANKAFNDTLEIRSPSRVGRRSGGFYSEGIELGIKDRFKNIRATATDLADLAATTVEKTGLNTEMSRNSSLGAFAVSQFSAGPEMAGTEPTPIAVQVKIGEETLIDRIIDGINSRSSLQNGAAIRI